MHPPTRDPTPAAAPELLVAVADRTTRCEGGPPPDDGLLPHLRVIVARVLRTGRGPADLVTWVDRQMADHPPPPTQDAVDVLAARLHARLLPPTPTVLETAPD
jgi:hypothetical protein